MSDAVHKGTFRRNVRWQLIGSVSQALLSGLLLLLMGRKLGAEGFGIFSIVMGFVYIANLLFEPRIQDVAAKQFWDFNREDSSGRHNAYFVDLFAVEVIGKLLPCIALILFASMLASVGHLPPGTSVLIMIAATGVYLSKLGNGLSVGLLRVLGRSDLYTYCATGELVLRLLLTLALVAFSELTVLECVLVLCISGITSNVTQWILLARQFDGVLAALHEWKLGAAVKRLLENRRLLISNIGLSASDLMNKDLDIILISPLISAGEVGVYKMAKNITLITWRAIDPFYISLMPEINRLAATGNFLSIRSLIFKISPFLFVFSIALSILSFGVLVLFGGIVLGPEFSGVLALMPWMIFGIVVSAPLIWGHPLSVALCRADYAFKGSLLGLGLGLVAFLCLTTYFNLVGAGLAWTISFITHFLFTSGASYFLMMKKFEQQSSETK